jgi:hypothetical protein
MPVVGEDEELDDDVLFVQQGSYMLLNPNTNQRKESIRPSASRPSISRASVVALLPLTQVCLYFVRRHFLGMLHPMCIMIL